MVRKDLYFSIYVYQQVISQLILGPFPCLSLFRHSLTHFLLSKLEMDDSITPNKFHDCHIFSLSSQGSIYTLCRLPNPNPYGRIRLLAASLRRPVFLLEFNHGYKESLVPYSRELSFTYLPGKGLFVAFCQCVVFSSFNFFYLQEMPKLCLSHHFPSLDQATLLLELPTSKYFL